MNIYNFIWSGYEEYECSVLLHKEKYSKKQFKNICYKASKEVISVVLSEEKDHFIGLPEIRKYASYLLVKKYGFVEANITLCSFWRGTIINKGDSKRDYGNSYCSKEILGKKLFNRIVEHNKKVEKRIGV